MKLEIMAKNVMVGDILLKGAHKYEVKNIEQVMSSDKVVIFYQTLKTKIVRCMKVAATEFVKVEQAEEVEMSPVEKMDVEEYTAAAINGDVEIDWHTWLGKRLDIDRKKFFMHEDLLKEALRVCIEVMENEEEGYSYFDNISDEYGDILNKIIDKSITEGNSEKTFEAEHKKQQAEEVKVEQYSDTFIVDAPQGLYAFIVGRTFKIGYEDKYGKYFFEKLTFTGFLNATDSLLFDDEEGNTLHMDPKGITYVWVNKEEPKEEQPEVITYKSMPWGSRAWSEFRLVAEIDGNEFGYYVQCNSFNEKEYKVIVFNNTGFQGRQQVLGYEDDLEGLERCLNNFLSKGFNFFMWEMEPQETRIKVLDAMTALADQIKSESN